ncbi:MAG: hypothetical protein GY906_30545 [bacterium]|nr:hypothetical protein [bacterium]
MKRLVIADAHLGQREGDAAAMCKFLHKAGEADCTEIVYLGDAFQYLIGMPKFWTSTVERVLPVWRELRSQQIRVLLVEGNRDFFLSESEMAPYVDASSRSYDFTAGEIHYRLVHGDRVNRDDSYYLFWCRVSKSSLARLWARLLPRRIAVAIVSHMEAKLARTNQGFRYKKPIAHLMRDADRAWHEDVDALLWGHFHTPWQYAAGGHIAMVIPAWLEVRVALVIAEDGQRWFVDEEMRELMPPLPTEELVP